ncbi:MAG: hypothetical protein LH472_06260 [Pyrinomonadaceae bacterium]|nr:hypothetical protein [Pyrinomonadaceae bacterium]
MSNLAWLITLTLLLTVAGILALGLTAKYYYWGSRGAPPPKKEREKVKKTNDNLIN